jgi:hypothetical protein
MIKAKDIQRIIAANETAQEASIEIKEMVDNYVEQQLKKCNLQSVSGSLPTKDEAVNKGYQIASDGGYNYRRVLKDGKDDIYFSGWMDCFDWVSNER